MTHGNHLNSTLHCLHVTVMSIFHRCFLPSFSSSGWAVSEEKIKMRKVNERRTPSDGNTCSSLTLRVRWANKIKIQYKSFYGNVHLHGITKCCYFRYDRLSNMAARGHKSLWLAEISKIFFSDTTWRMELKLVMNDTMIMHDKFQFHPSCSIGEDH
jgi:hypothetical protein